MRSRLLAPTVVLAALALVLAWGGRRLILARFAELEDREARQNAERALTALANELADLGTAVEDYADWDATYEYMRTHDPEFLRSSLPQAASPSFHIQYLALLDEAGAPVYGKEMDFDRHVDQPLEARVAERLMAAATPPLPGARVRTEGIARTGQGPVLIAWRPIVRNDGSGPPRGTLLMAHRFDQWLDEKLTRYARLTMTWRPYDDPALPDDFGWARERLSAPDPIVARPRGEDVYSAYALIRDVGDEPALLLRVDTYRRLHAEALFAANLLSAGVGLVALAGLALVATARRPAAA